MKNSPGPRVTYSNWVTDRLCDIPVSTVRMTVQENYPPLERKSPRR